MYFIVFNLLYITIQSIRAENPIAQTNELGLTFGHIWDQRDNIVTIYFDISNSTFTDYRYYYYEFRPFASHDQTEYFPRQRLIDTHNSLNIIGLHENDYVTCISFIDEYRNIFKPRYACYEFTLGEKIVGSHHGGSSGYLAPLLCAFAFVLHVFIAIVHYLKSKHYAGKLLNRFINVNPKTTKKILAVRHSLKQLDHPHISASVQRRLSRVTISTDENDENSYSMKKINDELPVYVLPHHKRKISSGVMQTIAEHNP